MDRRAAGPGVVATRAVFIKTYPKGPRSRMKPGSTRGPPLFDGGYTLAKASKTKKLDAPAPELSAEQIAESLISIPEIAEAFTRADLELALDDRGWLTTSAATAKEMDPVTRRTTIHKSRLYAQRDPLAKAAVRLWTVYCFGDGMSYKAKDKAKQKQLDQVLRHRSNRPVMTYAGQLKSSRKLLVEGDVYFACFVADGKVPVFRRIDPLQVVHIITDPDDDETILCYVRLMADGKTKKFYADWALDDEQRALAEQQRYENDPVQLEEGVVVYKAAFDAMGIHGEGLLTAAIDWTREHRRFMEARVALTAALSKYAHKLTVKGGQAVIDQAKQRLQSTLAKSGATEIEKNPTPAPGATWLQNGAATLEQMPRATGAGDGEKDSNQLKLMVCAATGIMLHYFGDPSTGNLATAVAMELPMLKQFLAYQKLWKDIYRDLFSIALEEDIDDEPAEIDIDFPPILKDDLTALATAISAMVTAFPEIAVDPVIRMCLVSLGIDDVDATMKEIEALREENAAKAAEIAAQGPAVPGAPGAKAKGVDGNQAPTTAPQGVLSNESARELAEALTAVAASLGR